ncbi:methyltransferase [Rhizobium sp. SSA_523]|uniref:methyltransferase n=1 Tax=Rhizobium sp. SSA_523 TaxID=2952477 RepID=UPI0020907D05|nr:methyltransferase [Rhizobium sp. SSA_523]MCO5732932.1 methyltransferase domain-containing protein [Rhizobium sp. SSA_523]WKC23820.1 methyltransferase domain-containing protein [Rhizobium sp. SSA_523]
MTPIQFSSGDVIADRRADYARMLQEAGDAPAAVDLLEQALERAPLWAAGWFLLGEYCEKAADTHPEMRGKAIAAFERVARLDETGIFGAELKLAVLGAGPMPETPPTAYVEGLFDDYADRFETALMEKLNYSVPEKLFAMVASHAPFDLTVDLGCGTGLFGAQVAHCSRRLEGYDLSANMLAKAQEKGIYAVLGQADLADPSATLQILSAERGAERADLVSAADVLMYLGNLDVTFALAAELLKPQGLFAFSIEDARENAQSESAESFVLQPSLRYAHSKSYVLDLLANAGFDLLDFLETDIRMDAGRNVQGILFLARKRKTAAG